MSPRTSLALLALFALAGLGTAINGGIGCRYVNPREVLNLVAAKTNTTYAAAVHSRMRFVNYYLCAGCGANLEMKFEGDVIDNLGECWCKNEFGYAEINTGFNDTAGRPIIRRQFGCSRCPTIQGFTGKSNATAGPYNPAASGPGPKLSNTRCIKA